MKNIQTADVSHKTVMVRVDYNIPLKNGEALDTSRIKASLPTIKDLQTRGAKVVLMSHLGRPDGCVDPKLSLGLIQPILQKLLPKSRVHFCAQLDGSTTSDSIKNMAIGDVLLLENLRFEPGEEKNDLEFSSRLASVGDLFVNDAFSASHRAHASIEGITHHLPSYAGMSLMAELSSLDTYLSSPKNPVWAIVGGAKISTKLPLLKALLDRADGLFVGGAMANTLLKSEGYNIGKSLVEDDLLPECRELVKQARDKHKTLLCPTDVVVAKHTKDHEQNYETIAVQNVRNDDMILDVGEHTLNNLSTHLKTASTILWNGPLGLVEVAPYDQGTKQLGVLISENTTAIKVAGGGDTVSILKALNLMGAFTYVSLAGGAFLEWLEGRILPGIAALNKA